MAQVKKLQGGGLTQNAKLLQKAEQKLKEANLSEKDRLLVAQSLQRFIELPRDQFKQEFLTKKYTVSGENSQDFEGSEDPLKEKLFSKNVKLSNSQDINSMAGGLYGEILKELETEEIEEAKIAKTNRRDYKIANYASYLEDFFEPEELERRLGDYNTNEERQRFMINPIKNLVNQYIETAESDPDNDYSDLEQAKKIKAALDNNNWEEFTNTAMPLKWDSGRYLLTANELKTIGDKKLEEETALKTKTDAETKIKIYNERLEHFKEKGIENPDLLKILADSDLEFFNPNLTSITQVGHQRTLDNDLYDYTTKNNYLSFKDAKGRFLFLNQNGEPVSIQGEGIDEGTPLAGNQWLYNQALGRAVHSPYTYPKEDYNAMFPNIPNGEILETSGLPFQGNLQDKINKYIQDLESQFVKNPDGSYAGLKMVGMKSAQKDTAAAILKANLNNIPFPQKAKVKDMLTLYQKNLQDIGIMPNDNINDNNSEGVIQKIDNWWNKNVLGEPIKRKKGGILKLQDGSIFKEYKKRLEAEKADNSSKTTSTHTPKDIRGTWKDMGETEKNWRKLSIAGAVGSVVPGIGVGGATTSLVADIAADVAKDGFQTSDLFNWNTAFNVGFVALSAIGLGGLRNIVKAGEAAKGIAKTSTSVAKFSTKVEKIIGSKSAIKNLGLTDEGLEGIKSLQTFAKNKGIKTTEELVEKVSDALTAKTIKSPELITKLEKGLETLAKISTSSTPIMGSRKLGSVVNTMRNATKAGAETSKNSALFLGKWGAKGAMVSPLVTDLPKTLYTGTTEGWEYTKPQDIKNIAIGAASSKILYSRWKDAKYLAGKNKYLAAAKEKSLKKLKAEEIKFKEGIKPNSIKRLPQNATPAKTKSINPVDIKIKSPIQPYSEAESTKNAKIIFDNNMKRLLSQGKKDKKTGLPKLPKVSELVFKKGGILKFQSPASGLHEKYNITNNILNLTGETAPNRTEYDLFPTISSIKTPKSILNTPIISSITSPITSLRERSLVEVEGNPNVKSNVLNKIFFGLKKGFQKAIKNVDATDLGNATMFASALSTNRDLEKNRKKALAASYYTESYMPQAPLLFTGSMDSMLAEKNANALRSKLNRVSKNTNLETGINAQLEGEEQIAQNLGTVKHAEKQRRDNLLTTNANVNYQTTAHNLEIGNRNKARAAQITSEMFKDPTKLLNHTAFSNLVLANNQNAKVKDYKKAVSNYYDALNNEGLKTGLEDLRKRYEAHESKLVALREAYKTNPAIANNKPFEESDSYLQWQNYKETLLNEKEKLIEPVKISKLFLEKQSNMFKKGGNLQKKRSYVRENRQDSMIRLKEKELVYKAIFHNNEMLLKTLSVLFK